MLQVSLGIDVEPDCPPYLATQYRGIEEGLPRVLDVLDELQVRTTCFVTGEVAQRYPKRIVELANRGHEVGCHGHSHRPFDTLDEGEARHDIQHSARMLRGLGERVMSFRAPNLRFPDRYLPLLEDAGFVVDSSQAKYKRSYYGARTPTRLRRFAASTTSSVLRLPRLIRDPWLLALSSPVVLFVHPWEFVDLRNERLRLDCRFRTGAFALNAIREVITLFRERGATFLPIRELVAPSGRAA